jgi:hypothetical protein
MPRGKPWTAWALTLLFLSVAAAALGAIGAIVWPGYAQLYFTSVLPSVRPCTYIPASSSVLLANPTGTDHFRSYPYD